MFRQRSITELLFILGLLAQLVAGCSYLDSSRMRISDNGQENRCSIFFSSLDQQVIEAGVLDSGDFRVTGYPYLRTNRFLASFRKEDMDKEAFSAWLNHMQALDQEARGYEIANLPARSPLISTTPRDILNHDVIVCGNKLKTEDFQSIDSNGWELRNQIDAPDEYSRILRMLGIYPLFRLFVSIGVDRWYEEVQKTFSTRPPSDWSTIRYVPENSGELPTIRQIVENTRRDALGIPEYGRGYLLALFRMHAPVWDVQVMDGDDRIGAPFWRSDGTLGVDTQNPLTYTYLSFTRFGNDILTQLNYVIWFPARPKINPLDLYGGFLDGITYRVTLDKNGKPLLYETIHNCGCYYMAFPAKGLDVREQINYAEPPLILDSPEVNPTSEFMAVAVKSRTHSVQHLYPLARETHSNSIIYSLTDYGQLRSLYRDTNERKSMFDPDGLVIGSERLERFILWPSGILSPGAMRQSGRHAVAFAGIRHFDDPFFLNQIFMETGF